MVATAAFWVETAFFGDRFEQRGFSGAILADKKSDVRCYLDIDTVGEGGDVEGIATWIDSIRRGRDAS
jgi:hypothetical protein